MSNFKVPREFADHFNTVTKHYNCTPEEIEVMKQCARNDMQSAVVSFAAMNCEING